MDIRTTYTVNDQGDLACLNSYLRIKHIAFCFCDVGSLALSLFSLSCVQPSVGQDYLLTTSHIGLVPQYMKYSQFGLEMYLFI